MNSGLRDRIIEWTQYGLGLTLALIGLCLLWYLDKGYLSSNDIKNSDAILINPTNQVRWRAVDDLDWKNVYDRAGLHFGDSIFTGESSTASLYLKDLKVDLAEKTLMVLKSADQVPLVDIDTGTVQMRLSEKQEKFKLLFKDQEMVLKKQKESKARVSISTSSSSQLDKTVGISVSEGQMELFDGSAEKFKLKTGDSLLIEKVDNKIKYKRVEFLLYFDSNRSFITREELPKIKWTIQNFQAKNWELGYSTNQTEFNYNLIESKKIKINKIEKDPNQLRKDEFFYEINKKLSPGRHYFQLKVQSEQGNELFSNIIFIDVVELRPPTVFDHLTTFLKPHESKIQLSIESIPFLEKYEVDLFKKSDRLEKIESLVSRNSHPEFIIKGHDVYYIKVRYSLKGLSQSSPWTEFIQIVIPPPLQSPKGKIAEYDLDRERVLIKWTPGKNVDYYELTGIQNRFSSQINQTNESQHWIPLLSEKAQKIFIISRKQNGQHSEPSPFLMIPGLLPAPDLIFYKRYPEPLARFRKGNKSLPKIVLKWTSKKDKSSTQIEVADNKRFKNSTTYSSIKQDIVIPTESKSNLYVRIQDVDLNKNLMSKFTKIIELPVPIPEKLLPPESLSPKNFESMLLIKKYGANLELKWSSCKEASRYDLEIQRNDSKRGLISQSFNGLIKNEYIYKKPKSGSYKWRIKCLNGYFESEWSEFKEFSITYGK